MGEFVAFNPTAGGKRHFRLSSSSFWFRGGPPSSYTVYPRQSRKGVWEEEEEEEEEEAWMAPRTDTEGTGGENRISTKRGFPLPKRAYIQM